jgi:hypothetical protein
MYYTTNYLKSSLCLIYTAILINGGIQNFKFQTFDSNGDNSFKH